jgi:hypothetical protein
MSNGAVVIADPGDKGFVWGHDQFTLATGLPGLVALRDAIDEVIEEVKTRRRTNVKGDED